MLSSIESRRGGHTIPASVAITLSITMVRSITVPAAAVRNWLIGRLSAECAFCSTALPLRKPRTAPRTGSRVWSGARPSYAELNAA